MRTFTVVVAVLLVGGIIGAGIGIVIYTEDSRKTYEEIQDGYDIPGYLDALEDEGFSIWNPGRLWPGSLDPMVSVKSCTGISFDIGCMSNSYYIVNN